MPHPTILQLSHGSFKIWEEGSNSEQIANTQENSEKIGKIWRKIVK
jgi:hypothetical protein